MLADQTAPEGSPLETLAAVADAGRADRRRARLPHRARRASLHDYVVALCGATRRTTRGWRSARARARA